MTTTILITSETSLGNYQENSLQNLSTELQHISLNVFFEMDRILSPNGKLSVKFQDEQRDHVKQFLVLAGFVDVQFQDQNVVRIFFFF